MHIQKNFFYNKKNQFQATIYSFYNINYNSKNVLKQKEKKCLLYI